ncbi:hypothetical protein AB0885_43000, partial [Streptomyces sp. NPDC005534]
MMRRKERESSAEVSRGATSTGVAIGSSVRGLIAVGIGLVLTVGAAVVVLPGFDGIEDVPLPGGADLGSHPQSLVQAGENATESFCVLIESQVGILDVRSGCT